LTAVFGPKMIKVTGECKVLHIVEIYIPHSPYIFWVIKSRIMIWADRVADLGNRRVEYRVLLGSSEARSPLGSLGLDEKIVCKWITKIFYGRHVLG